MTFAESYPDMIQKLVSIDMGPQQYAPGHDLIFKAMLSLDVEHLVSRNDAALHLRKYIEEEDVILFLLKNLKREEKGFSWKFNLEVLYRDYDQILLPLPDDAEIEHPTLFIRGANSNYIDINRHQSLIAKIFKDPVIKTIDDAGHWVHADQPEVLETALREFLD